MKLYTIKDTKSESCTPPFVARNNHDATRQTSMFLAQNPTAMPATYCDDYVLLYIGDWDDSVGTIVPGYEVVSSLSALVAQINTTEHSHGQQKN